MNIRWLREAVADLDRIDDYWRTIDSRLARGVGSVMLGLAESPAELSQGGPPSRADPQSGELIGGFGAGACILRRRPLEDEVVVVQVRHPREDR